MLSLQTMFTFCQEFLQGLVTSVYLFEFSPLLCLYLLKRTWDGNFKSLFYLKTARKSLFLLFKIPDYLELFNCNEAVFMIQQSAPICSKYIFIPFTGQQKLENFFDSRAFLVHKAQRTKNVFFPKHAEILQISDSNVHVFG